MSGGKLPGEPRRSSLAVLKGLVPFLSPYRRQFLMAGVALVLLLRTRVSPVWLIAAGAAVGLARFGLF